MDRRRGGGWEHLDIDDEPARIEPDKLSPSEPANIEPDKLSPSDDDTFQAGVIKLKDQYETLDKEIREGIGIVVRGVNQIIPAMLKMEPLLSRKGDQHDPNHVRMLVAAGLPTWDDYKEQVAWEFQISVRTVQRKLERARGHRKENQPLRGSAADLLAAAQKELGPAAAAGSEQAAAILAEYESRVVPSVVPSVKSVKVDEVGELIELLFGLSDKIVHNPALVLEWTKVVSLARKIKSEMIVDAEPLEPPSLSPATGKAVSVTTRDAHLTLPPSLPQRVRQVPS